jgi:pimeloyl-ACP methyl ester carboxylesterase
MEYLRQAEALLPFATEKACAGSVWGQDKMDEHSERFQDEEASIYYQTRGSGDPLVLVHGLSGSSRWWARNVNALARDFRVYMVDLAGFGQSPGKFVLGEAADRLAAWMETLELEKVRLIGHSMGGYIAADLAARHGNRLERLVLVDALAVPMQRTLTQTALGLMLAIQYMPLGFMPVLVNDAWRAGAPTLLHAVREVLSSDLSEKLQQIEVPTLIVWGEHDTLLTPEVGERLHRKLPHALFVVIPGAGHNPMWDRPAEFNQLMRSFL